jgi:hypothetical protein
MHLLFLKILAALFLEGLKLKKLLSDKNQENELIYRNCLSFEILFRCFINRVFLKVICGHLLQSRIWGLEYSYNEIRYLNESLIKR